MVDELYVSIFEISMYMKKSTLGTEPKGSTSLIPKSATGHDPKLASSISHPHCLSL
jgi:hypothetical protein